MANGHASSHSLLHPLYVCNALVTIKINFNYNADNFAPMFQHHSSNSVPGQLKQAEYYSSTEELNRLIEKDSGREGQSYGFDMDSYHEEMKDKSEESKKKISLRRKFQFSIYWGNIAP